MAQRDDTFPSRQYSEEELDKIREKAEADIRHNRNALYNEGRCKSILISHILAPIIAHGSHLIYAPDEQFWVLYNHLTANPFVPPNPIVRRTPGYGIPLPQEEVSGVLSHCHPWALLKGVKRNPIFCLVVIVGLVAFKLEGAELKCDMQTSFLSWALWNQTLSWWERALSISVMMVLRLVIANIFPFTSPAFAYLIARAQPIGYEGFGTFYLLFCSMPAGLVIPVLDKLAYTCYGQIREKKISDPDDRVEQHFIVTNAASLLTDHLPFSFWVRPFFMQPAFLAVSQGGKFTPATAAASAVLAGHFMIWAGPATTMHQRKFVPDWWTCCIIQPLGLFEDVAVVLATWAGASPDSQKNAELSLYGFMFSMNLMRWAATKLHDDFDSTTFEHLFVAFLTLIAAVVKYCAEEVYTTSTTSKGPTTTTTSELCATDHSNVGAMIHTVLKVSVLAVAFRLTARSAVLIHGKVMGRGGASTQDEHAMSTQPLLPQAC